MSAYRSPHRKHERQSFFKYVTASTAQAIISGRCLRWSSPLLFNDPFDVPRELDVGFTGEDLSREVVAEFVRAIQDGQNVNDPRIRIASHLFRSDTDPDRKASVLSAIRESIPPAFDLDGPLKAAWREFIPQMRILCVSECNDSPAMWAHYAEGHRGAVFEFACSDALDSSLLLANPITYLDTPPALPPKEFWARMLVRGEAMDWQEYFREYYYTKHSSWAYEREWRVISYAPDNESELFSTKTFNPAELIGVYFGAGMSNENYLTCCAALPTDFKHVAVHKARFDRTSRTICFDTTEARGR